MPAAAVPASSPSLRVAALTVVAELAVPFGEYLGQLARGHVPEELLGGALVEPEGEDLRAVAEGGAHPHDLHGSVDRALVQLLEIGRDRLHPFGDIEDLGLELLGRKGATGPGGARRGMR